MWWKCKDFSRIILLLAAEFLNMMCCVFKIRVRKWSFPRAEIAISACGVDDFRVRRLGLSHAVVSIASL